MYIHGIQEAWRYIYRPSHDWSLKEEELEEPSSHDGFCSSWMDGYITLYCQACTEKEALLFFSNAWFSS